MIVTRKQNDRAMVACGFAFLVLSAGYNIAHSYWVLALAAAFGFAVVWLVSNEHHH